MRYAIISVILLVSAVYADTFFISEGNLDDPSFEEELANGQFPDWTFSGSGSFIREEYREYDGDTYAIIEAETAGDGGPDNYSCKVVRKFDGSFGLDFRHIDVSVSQNEVFSTPIQRIVTDKWHKGFMITGYVRTREVDTLRLLNPYQWIKCGRDFKVPSEPGNGKYLGGVNLNFVADGAWLPHDEDHHIWWKSHSGDAAVAEWNWTFWYPRKQYLKDLWFDPFMAMEREVTW